MAGARIPLSGSQAQKSTRKRKLVRRFLLEFGVAGERPVTLLSADEN
jgi:hypothetical protein